MEHKYNIKQPKYDYKIIDFMQWNFIAFIISGILILTSFGIIFTKGFNLGLDFTGGTVIEMSFKKEPDLNVIRSVLEKYCYINPIIQHLGNNHDIIIRMPPIKNLSNRVIEILRQVMYGDISIKRLEIIGPSIGTYMIQTSEMAILIALICILLYLGLRFELRLALGAVISLIHDIIITLGILSLIHFEINLTIIASLMSVISYSLNDSIVISDRIRENCQNICYSTTYNIINISLTQTLHRTIITSAITLSAVLILYIFGGIMLQGFALTMFIGVFIGTISSIYIASSLALKLGMKREHMYLPYVDKEGADNSSMYLL
uniref:protein translocase subunit SecF n=1 Tax=Candidatus Profftia sp. (ex Adelges kitamiensis) TaxID=2864218 RepID=UPI001CE3154F|nr:protein translocase subunit SecF [Candidatus Profftia sp. (ex Adelges kitamiensis)]